MTLLSDIKVLDLTRTFAGPWATQCLADFGATIWKIEAPQGHEARESAFYLSTNRGKRSVAIDIRTPEGQELVRRLAARADVLVENFKAGTLARHGLDYEQLQSLNPRLVYCSMSADAVAGVPGVPYEASNLMADMYAVSAIIAALYERQRSGAGQHIDLALMDTLSGSALAPHQAFATADGYLMLAVANDRQFTAFCAAAGRPEWAQDERYSTNALRVENRAALVAQIAAVCREKSTQQWLDALRPAGVPCGPVHDLAQVFDEPEAAGHRGLTIHPPEPWSNQVPHVRHPVRFRRTPLQDLESPPLLGQHTDEVLTGELGLTLREIAALSMRAVIN
jgi:crotonobetainyl-CoA:carnitine CoA-transferase CaiB-like acyl-CoA transferase